MSGDKTIDVVGGIYIEHCLAPPRREIQGSGGRAAIAIRVLGGASRLTTCADESTRDQFEAVANAHGVSLSARTRAQSITFGYAHPLAVPTLVPPRHRIPQEPQLIVTADSVLRFGMIECDVLVHARQAVYDPQDPGGPQSFRANGSTADRLALILNQGEARQLLRSPPPADTETLAKMIAGQENADVVIIKLGAAGACVYDSTGVATVPAYQTPRVWKIGSGDTFSAAFAYYWMNEGLPAAHAARRASLAAALYCNGGDINNLIQLTPLAEVTRRVSSKELPAQVYLAGPFFTTAELWLVTEAWRFLRESHVPVFSPYHDVGIGAGEEVAPKDLEALRRSSVVLALVDGSDAGTLFEVGYARALNIPVIALSENPREQDLKMITGSGCELYADFAAALYRVAALA